MGPACGMASKNAWRGYAFRWLWRRGTRSSGAYRVYQDPFDRMQHLDEVGIRNTDSSRKPVWCSKLNSILVWTRIFLSGRSEVPCPITNSIVARARNPLLRSCGWLTTRREMSSARAAVAGKSNSAGQRSLSSHLERAREGSLTVSGVAITPKHLGDIVSHRGPCSRTPAFVIRIPLHRRLCVECAPLRDQGAALVAADQSREPEVMSRGALGSTAPAEA